MWLWLWWLRCGGGWLAVVCGGPRLKRTGGTKRENEDVPFLPRKSIFLVVVGRVNLSRGTTLKIVDVMPLASDDETTQILNAPVEIKVA